MRNNLFAFLFILKQAPRTSKGDGVRWLHGRVESRGQGAPRLGLLPPSGNRAQGQQDQWPLLMHVLAVAKRPSQPPQLGPSGGGGTRNPCSHSPGPSNSPADTPRLVRGDSQAPQPESSDQHKGRVRQSPGLVIFSDMISWPYEPPQLQPTALVPPQI